MDIFFDRTFENKMQGATDRIEHLPQSLRFENATSQNFSGSQAIVFSEASAMPRNIPLNT
jgi:hypothetical protein